MTLVVSWNINSINARLDRVVAFCQRHKPQILCLQEIKCVTEAFPSQKFSELGYHCAVYGQKGYNGVAVLSLTQIHQINRGLWQGENEARFLGCCIGHYEIWNCYVPNGRDVSDSHYQLKLNWLKNLHQKVLKRGKKNLILAGDFNVALTDNDVYDAEKWHEKILCSTLERCALREILHSGLSDSYRVLEPLNPGYTWWDYRALGFPKNKGMRIDYILVDNDLLPQCRQVWVDRQERKGDKPSDHAPVILKFSDEMTF